MSSNEMIQLVGSYKRALNTPEGEVVLDDLRKFAKIDEPAGSDLSLQECSYRNGIQDLFKYIDALRSDDV